jgi:hypothetical protein
MYFTVLTRSDPSCQQSAKDAAAGEMIAVTFIINKRLTLFSHRNLDYSKPITTHSLHNHTTPTF